MNKDKIEFFVLAGTEEEREIQKIMNCLDENSGEYVINYVTNNENTPILKVTFTAGECYEYDESEMYRIILNYVKIGMKIPR